MVKKAKFKGGEQIQVLVESVKSLSREKLEMEHELRTGLENGE